MTGIELRISGVGGDCSTNCATPNARNTRSYNWYTLLYLCSLAHNLHQSFFLSICLSLSRTQMQHHFLIVNYTHSYRSTFPLKLVPFKILLFIVNINLNWSDSQQHTNLIFHSLSLFCKKWAIPGLFFFIFVFTIQLVVIECSIYKFCQWLESNRKSLVLEVTALPTAPQPMPETHNITTDILNYIFALLHTIFTNPFFFLSVYLYVLRSCSAKSNRRDLFQQEVINEITLVTKAGLFCIPK